MPLTSREAAEWEREEDGKTTSEIPRNPPRTDPVGIIRVNVIRLISVFHPLAKGERCSDKTSCGAKASEEVQNTQIARKRRLRKNPVEVCGCQGEQRSRAKSDQQYPCKQKPVRKATFVVAHLIRLGPVATQVSLACVREIILSGHEVRETEHETTDGEHEHADAHYPGPMPVRAEIANEEAHEQHSEVIRARQDSRLQAGEAVSSLQR
mmetsp:Transcript_7301/g.14009  ORF Transcript_7301/g.14009 Transcript_7301/m.14009 type:complete len:209 (+) Transcript_7301:3-629(+)